MSYDDVSYGVERQEKEPGKSIGYGIGDEACLC